MTSKTLVGLLVVLVVGVSVRTEETYINMTIIDGPLSEHVIDSLNRQSSQSPPESTVNEHERLNCLTVSKFYSLINSFIACSYLSQFLDSDHVKIGWDLLLECLFSPFALSLAFFAYWLSRRFHSFYVYQP